MSVRIHRNKNGSLPNMSSLVTGSSKSAASDGGLLRDHERCKLSLMANSEQSRVESTLTQEVGSLMVVIDLINEGKFLG